MSRTVDATDPAVLSIGKIEGGARSNIIAQEVTFEGTLRTLSEKNRKNIPRLMENIVKGITQPFDAEYSFTFRKGTPSVYNYPDLISILSPSLVKVLGKDKIREIKPQMVAEDFSYFCQKIPGFYYFLGIRDPLQKTTPPLHNPYFNPDERSISVGIKIMSHLILDFLDHQSRIDN